MLHHVLLEGGHARVLRGGGHWGVRHHGLAAGEEGVVGEGVVEGPWGCRRGRRVGSRCGNEVLIEVGGLRASHKRRRRVALEVARWGDIVPGVGRAGEVQVWRRNRLAEVHVDVSSRTGLGHTSKAPGDGVRGKGPYHVEPAAAERGQGAGLGGAGEGGLGHELGEDQGRWPGGGEGRHR